MQARVYAGKLDRPVAPGLEVHVMHDRAVQFVRFLGRFKKHTFILRCKASRRC